HGRARDEAIGGTRRGGARAALGYVTDTGRRTTDGRRRHEPVCGAGIGYAVARFDDVAHAGGRPTDAPGGDLPVGRAIGRACAVLGHVAHAARAPTNRARRLEDVRRTSVGYAVAGLEDVADARGGPTRGPRGHLRIGRTVGRAGAVLGQVAHAGRAPTDRARRQEDVRRTRRGSPRAGLLLIADAGRRAA